MRFARHKNWREWVVYMIYGYVDFIEGLITLCSFGFAVPELRERVYFSEALGNWMMKTK